MTSPFLKSIAVLALLLPLFGQAQQSQRGSEPLIPTIEGLNGDIGLRYQTDRRALDGLPEDTDTTFGSSSLKNPLEVDFEQIILRLSAQPLKSLTVHAEGGWSEAELDGQKADGDLIWGIGGQVNLLEKILQGSAEQPKKEVLRLSVEVNYRSTEAEFNSDSKDGDTLEFDELEVIPLFTYERNNDLNLDRSSYAPPGTAAHVGVVLNSIEASLAEFDLEEKEAASLLLGFDLRWKSGWATQVRAIISSDSDRRIGIGARYNF